MPEKAASLVASLYRAEQLDLIHLSLINLLDMIKDGEIDLLLDQPDKSAKQKQLFVEKLISTVGSPDLRSYLESLLKEKGVEAFRERDLGDILHSLQADASQCVVVRLNVAVDFKENDLREMADLLSSRLGKQTVLSVKVDSSLIGGAIVQYGSYVSDYSVKTQIDLFRSHWHRAVVEQK